MSRELTASEKVSASLRGKFGEQARRWKGDDASYVAKHQWLLKHFGPATTCEFGADHKARRYEWANVNHGESRRREDYIQLCPSCHRLFDQQGKCRRGHQYTPETTHINCRGHRSCLICKKERGQRDASGN